MHEPLLALVKIGMDVCDMTGEKTGTLGEVYPRVAVGTRLGGRPGADAEPTHDAASYVRLDTDFLDLGKRLYVPASVLSDVTDFVLVDVQRDHLDRMHWAERPPFLKDP